jgi:hypothetical protein
MLAITDELPGSGLMPVAGGQVEQAPAKVAADYLQSLVTGRELRLGARTSPMAVAQAEHVAGLLGSLVPSLEVTIIGINTTADQWAGDLAALRQGPVRQGDRQGAPDGRDRRGRSLHEGRARRRAPACWAGVRRLPAKRGHPRLPRVPRVLAHDDAGRTPRRAPGSEPVPSAARPSSAAIARTCHQAWCRGEYWVPDLR